MNKRNLLKIWLVMALAFILGSTGISLKTGFPLYQLSQRGVIISAPIIATTTLHPAKSSPCASAVYEFQLPDGKKFSNLAQCDATKQQQLTVGGRMEITYLPDNPTINRPGTFSNYSLFKDVGMAFLLSSIASIILLLLSLVFTKISVLKKKV
jgi:hypothetical protein